MSRKTGLRLLVAALLASGIAVFLALDLQRYFSLAELAERRDALLAYTETHLAQMLAAYMAVYIVMAALSLPGAAIVTIAGGTLFGVVAGTLAASFASTIGATLVFLAARFLFREPVQKRFRHRLETINRGVERDGAFYLLALRLVPAFPFWVINLVMALTPIRTWTFYWVSQLGMLPATVVFVNAGTQLGRVDRVGDILSAQMLGALALLALLPLLLRWSLRWLRARRVYAGHRRPRRFDYNLVVIGGGAAGLVSAYIGATVRAEVALIEGNRLGGDCLNTGCVPSKTLLRTAKLLADARDSQRWGIRKMDAEFDFKDVMARVREAVAKIEPHDSRERYENMGVDVYEAHATLVSPWEVEVDGKRISARSIVLATGAEPAVPPIPGLQEIEYLTSDNLWDLQELPGELVVLGGGPIGCELAQAFARLGARVTVVEMADRLLPREDAEAGETLAQALEAEGATLATGHKASRVEPGRLVCSSGEQEVSFSFDRLLVALGRRARTESFGLERLGVKLAPGGTIGADQFQRTNFPNIYVCGDAAGPYQFTHVGAHQAWSAAVNALIAPWWSFRTDYSAIPWATFTDPEVAHVGLTREQATEREIDHEVTRYDLDELDRAITDGETTGFVQVLTPPGKDRILGVTIVGAHAAELLAEFVLAIKHGLGLGKILGTVHVYPTYSEAARFTAGEWKKAHSPQRLLRVAERFFRWRRGGDAHSAATSE